MNHSYCASTHARTRAHTRPPRRYIEELVAAEAKAGVPSERVVVAGFSQGGAVALTMLRSEHKLAGVVGERAVSGQRSSQPA